MADAACWCCGEPAPIRGEGDPWEGRLDGYCESCASTRCDTTDSTCAVKRSAASTVAALFVETGGVYYGLPGVDPWDEQRDARLYAGPYPVVAHPPCARWGQLANVNHARYGTSIGEDGGCFEAALRAVREFGGVLEHPANSIAWRRFGLPKATRGAWTTCLDDPGASTEVSQVVYGHGARKRTWLYAVGAHPELDWTDRPGLYVVGAGINTGECRGRRLPDALAARTPEAFRDMLIDLARAAGVRRVAA